MFRSIKSARGLGEEATDQLSTRWRQGAEALVSRAFLESDFQEVTGRTEDAGDEGGDQWQTFQFLGVR